MPRLPASAQNRVKDGELFDAHQTHVILSHATEFPAPQKWPRKFVYNLHIPTVLCWRSPESLPWPSWAVAQSSPEACDQRSAEGYKMGASALSENKIWAGGKFISDGIIIPPFEAGYCNRLCPRLPPFIITARKQWRFWSGNGKVNSVITRTLESYFKIRVRKKALKVEMWKTDVSSCMARFGREKKS